MAKSKGAWTDDKVDALQELYPTHTLKQLSEKLEMSVGSIHNMVDSLNNMNMEQCGQPAFPPKKPDTGEIKKRALARWFGGHEVPQGEADQTN